MSPTRSTRSSICRRAPLRRHVHALIASVEEIIAAEGHTRVGLQRAVANAGRLLHAPLDDRALRACRRVSAIAGNEDQITLMRYCRAEEYTAGKLVGLRLAVRPPALYPEIGLDGLAPDQVAAVTAARREPVFILCGAPGTGKTYTLARMIGAFRAAKLTVALAAPTGKAAKQMSRALQPLGAGTRSRSTRYCRPRSTRTPGNSRLESASPIRSIATCWSSTRPPWSMSG